MAGDADAGLELRLERDRGAFVLANVVQSVAEERDEVREVDVDFALLNDRDDVERN